MPDRENVIKGLEHCVEKLDTVVNKTHGFNCTTCPYFSKCDRSGYLIGLPLMHDALALLKAQEAVEPTKPDEDNIRYCGACGSPVGYEVLEAPGIEYVQYRYCPQCGQAVKWE